MENLVRIDDILINVSRLIAVCPRPDTHKAMPEGSYLATFDTGQHLILTPSTGAALMDHFQSLRTSPSLGTMATSSETEI
jgi:hypothetical protein